MDAVREIVREAPRFLSPDGVLVVEVGGNRAETEAAFPRMPFTWLAQADDAVFVLRREELVAGR
jgi:ribosomal protein L3 glutamine methyltransferase